MASKKNDESTALTVRTEMGLGKAKHPSDALLPPQLGVKTLPKLVTLKEPGDYIDGKILGLGAPVEVKRPDGDTVPVATWLFEIARDAAGNAIVVKLSSNYQLDKELPDLVGYRTRVILNGEVDTRSGNRVKDFFIQHYVDAEFTDSAA